MNKICPLFLSLILITTICIFTIPNAKANTPTENTWETKPPLPQTGSGLKAVAVNDKIYVFHQLFTYMYNPATNDWTQKTAMPTPRTDYAIAVIENKIFIMGGEGANMDSTNVNEVFDTQTNTWETKKALFDSSTKADACVVEGKIYVLNNQNIEAYDPANDTWTKIVLPSNYYFSWLQPVAINERIYFIGGDEPENSTTLIFNTKTGKWDNGQKIPEFCNRACTAATTGKYAPSKIYVIGGYHGFIEKVLNTTYVYDTEFNTWNLATSMPTARFNFAIAVLNDKIYCIGGAIDWFEYTQTIEVYTPKGFGTVQPSDSAGGNSESSQPTTTLIAGAVVAGTVIAAAGITVYRFRHVPVKAAKAS
jgi:N-acetylneuraminic acid mutarotase